MGWKIMSVTRISVSQSKAGLERKEVLCETRFDVLNSSRRREAVPHLKQHESGSLPLRDLVDHVVTQETDVSINGLDSDRRNVYTASRRAYLPELNTSGHIEYDLIRDEAHLMDNASAVDSYLTSRSDQNISWSRYYVGLGGIGLLGGLWMLAGVYSFPLVSWAHITLALIALVGMAVLLQGIHFR